QGLTQSNGGLPLDGHVACRGSCWDDSIGSSTRLRKRQSESPEGSCEWEWVHSRAESPGCSIQPDLQDGRIRPWDDSRSPPRCSSRSASGVCLGRSADTSCRPTSRLSTRRQRPRSVRRGTRGSAWSGCGRCCARSQSTRELTISRAISSGASRNCPKNSTVQGEPTVRGRYP